MGKQATLFIEKGLSEEKYDDFIEFARKIQPDTKKLIEKKEKKMRLLKKQPAAVADERKWGRILMAYPLPVLGKIFAGKEMVSMYTKNKDIEDQQYTCAILYFYLNDLSTFMGI